MIPHRFSRAAMLLTLVAAPSVSRADQFVLFDVTFTYSKQDADTSKPSKSHHYVKGDRLNKDRPRDWDGSDRLSEWHRPHPRRGHRQAYRRRAYDLDNLLHTEPREGKWLRLHGDRLYREKGIYEQDISMKEFWENDSILWSMASSRWTWSSRTTAAAAARPQRKDPEKFFPTRMRITVVQVSAGAKYDASLVPNLPGNARTRPDRRPPRAPKGAAPRKLLTLRPSYAPPDSPSIRLCRRHRKAQMMGGMKRAESCPIPPW